MKKYYVALLAFCLGIAQTVSAENTDVSTIDNVIYIEPISVAAGSQHVVSVKMKNAVEAQGYGFDLYLPEGASFAVDGDGFPEVEMSTERTTAKKTDTFNSVIQANGSLRVFATSTGGYTIGGNDGEIARVTISVAANMTLGDYPLLLKEVTVTDLNSVGYDTDEVETTLTVTAPADTRTLLDETSTTAPAAASNVDVRVKRTITAGVWNTICLPFAMTATQVKEAFGDDVLLASFKNWETTAWDDDDNATGISVEFQAETAIDANKPYIIKVSQEVSEFTVDGVDIDPESEPSITVGKMNKGTFGSFTGTYVANTTIDEECLFLNNNSFWYSTGNTKSKGYRAYFYFQEVLDSYGTDTNARMRIAFNETNRMDGVKQAAAVTDGNIYSLQGVQVENPQKGPYIKDGKVVIFK